MVSVRTLLNKMIHTWPVMLLFANWYGTHPLLINFTDHDIVIYVKYALTGVIPLIFVLIVIQTKRYTNRILVNIPLVFGFILALCQLYYMGWNIIHSPWPVFKLTNLPKYLEMISRLNIPYILCSIFPVLVIIKLFKVLNQKLSRNNKDPKNTHGSARFATQKEVRKFNKRRGIPIGLIPNSTRTEEPEEFVQDVQQQHGGEILRLNPHHMVLIAPSGSGKGTGIVIPTILDYPGPLVITDIKAAENFYVTARYRRSQERDIYVFDPDEATPQKSININVLDYLDPTSRKIVDDVGILTSIIRPIPKEDYHNAKYFAEYAMAILQCLILYVLGDKDTPQEKKNLPQIYDLLCQDDAELKDLFRQIKERPDICYGTPSRLAATVLATTEREISGALNSAREELRFIDSPIMRELTEKSTVNLHNIIENKADLYICVPSEAMEYQGRAVRFLIATIFLLLRKRKSRPKVPLLMVLDEMPLLGRIPTIEKALIIGRGYRLKLMCIAQTIESISSTYPDSWKTMLASNLSVFIGASDIDTGKYISERIGQRTVQYQSENKGESQQKSSFLRPNVSASKSDSTHYVGRSVLTPDEVTLLGDHVVVAFMRGKRPMLLRRLEYFEHHHWKEKADPNPLEVDCVL